MIPKFRFWYEREDFYLDENYMRDVWKIECLSNDEIVLNDDYLFNPHTNVAENSYAKTRIYLMQSTGLKDKNGVEIYEDDIVKITNTSRFLGEEHTCYSKVKIVDGHVCVWTDPIIDGKTKRYGMKLLFDGKAKYIGMRGVATNDVEVVGDIYRNPELLEVEKCQRQINKNTTS